MSHDFSCKARAYGNHDDCDCFLSKSDNTQELDPIINIMDMWDFSPFQDEDTRRERVYKEIQAYTNAEIAKVLDRLEAQASFAMYMSVERAFIPMSAIQAERAKLKEVK